MPTVVGVNSEPGLPPPEQTEKTPLEKYQEYQRQQQQLNSSGIVVYEGGQKPGYASGGANDVPQPITARDILTNRTMPSPPASSLKPLTPIIQPDNTKASSNDSFSTTRSAALKSGKFDYSSVSSAFYSPPKDYVNQRGERVPYVGKPLPEDQNTTPIPPAKHTSELISNDSYGTDTLTVSPSKTKASDALDEYLKTPQGQEEFLNYVKTNAENQLIIFGNKLITYHNNLIDQRNQETQQNNQLIEQQNIMNKANAGIDKLGFEGDLIKSAGPGGKIEILRKVPNENAVFPAHDTTTANQPLSVGAKQNDIQKLQVLETIPVDKAKDILPGLVTKYQNDNDIVYRTTGPTQTIKGVETTRTEYVRQNDTPLKTAVATFIEPFAYTGLGIEAMAASLVGRNLITGAPSPIGYGATEEQVQTKLTSVIGPTYIDQIMSGDFNSNTLTPAEKVASGIGFGASIIPWLAGGGSGSAASRFNIFRQKTWAERIAQSFQEGKQQSKVQKPEDPLTGQIQTKSKIYEITQGTDSVSGLTSYKVEKPIPFEETVMSEKTKTTSIEVKPGKFVTVEEFIPETKPMIPIVQTGTKVVPHNPTDEEIAKRYPLFGQGPPEELKPIPETELKPVFGPGEVKQVPVTKTVTPELPSYIKETTPVATIGQTGTAEPSLFPEDNSFGGLSRYRVWKNRITQRTPGSENLKIVSVHLEKSTLGFVNNSEKNTIYLNAATIHKGAFTPENVIDLISHETLHNTINDVAGPRASSELDKLYYAGPRENRLRLLDLGIQPSSLRPNYEPTSDLLNDDTFQNNFNSFIEQEKSIRETTFEGQTEPKPIFGKVIVEQPTTVKLNEEVGPTNKPLTLVGPESTLVARSQPQDVLPPDLFIAYDITPGQAAHLGFEPLAGMKNTFIGKANPHNIEKINELLNTEDETGKKIEPKLKAGTDYFEFPSKELASKPDIYGYATDNPEVFLSDTFKDIKPIYGPVQPGKQKFYVLPKGQAGPYAGIVRPRVIRPLQGTNPGGYELKPEQKQIDLTRPNKKMKPLDLSGMEQEKGSAGASARSVNLLTEVGQASSKTINPQPKEEKINLDRYTPSALSLTRRHGKESFTTEYEFIAYPPTQESKLSTEIKLDVGVSSKSKLSDKLSEMTEQKIDLGIKARTSEQGKTLEKTKTLELTKSVSNQKTKTIQDTINDQQYKLTPDVILKERQDTVLMPLTKEITEQKQKELIINIPGIPENPPPHPPKFPIFIKFLEENVKEKPEKMGKVKRYFYSWNVNTKVVGGYLPGKELRVGKTVKGTIRAHEKLEKRVNRGKVPRRARPNKREIAEKQTFQKLDKTIYKKPNLKGKKFRLGL